MTCMVSHKKYFLALTFFLLFATSIFSFAFASDDDWKKVDISKRLNDDQIKTLENHVDEMKSAALQGDADAAIKLSGLYSSPRSNMPKDYVSAVKWITIAANQGVARAELGLSQFYGLGKGVPENLNEAFLWAKKAADQYYAPAELVVGIDYYKGLGIQRDYTNAVKWLHFSAEQGNSQAQGLLGILYANGEGVQRNHREAFFWLSLDHQNTKTDHSFDTVYESEKKELLPYEIEMVEKKLDAWKSKK